MLNLQKQESTLRPAKLNDLEKIVKQCVRCSLCESRTNTVFGEGNPNADLLFVGEGPGHQEDQTGRPFVGRAGKLLNEAISSRLNITRSEVYICNIVKCRPPKNRPPLPEEVNECLPFLVNQIYQVNPKVIITLGNTPKEALTGVKEGITKLRGTWLEWRGIPLMPTFHPAYLLRNPNKMDIFYEDLIEAFKLIKDR